MYIHDILFSCVILHFAVGDETKIVPFPKNIVGIAGTVQPRIFGGATAVDGQFPYMVFYLYLQKKSGVASCSASLVAPDKVLLAAHCFEGDANPNPKDVIAVAGKSDLVAYMGARSKAGFYKDVDEASLGLQERRAATIYISPKYNADTLRHDVALFVVTRPFQLNANVAVIPIANGEISQRTKCTIQGWGLAEENKRSYRLLYVNNAHALPLPQCIFKEKTGPFFCLQKTTSGICQGDSGSPVVCGGQVYGVASHVLSQRHDAQCGDDLEEFYATVLPEMVWMSDILNPKKADLQPTTTTTGRPGSNHGAHLHALTALLLVSFFCLIV